MSELKPCPFCGGYHVTNEGVTNKSIHCVDCGSYGPSPAYDIDSHGEPIDASWNTRAAPKVKRLLWENPSKDNNYIHIARTLFGDYGIHICGGRHMAWIEKNVKPYEEFIGEEVGSVPEAKAAAQSHYEKQILEALE
jgi:hypothetical protein